MRHFLLVHFQLIVACIIKHKNEIKNCQIYKASYHFIWNNFLLGLDQRIKSNQTLFICLLSQWITKILQCVPWKNQLSCFEIMISIIRFIKISPQQPHLTSHPYQSYSNRNFLNIFHTKWKKNIFFIKPRTFQNLNKEAT